MKRKLQIELKAKVFTATILHTERGNLITEYFDSIKDFIYENHTGHKPTKKNRKTYNKVFKINIIRNSIDTLYQLCFDSDNVQGLEQLIAAVIERSEGINFDYTFINLSYKVYLNTKQHLIPDLNNA